MNKGEQTKQRIIQQARTLFSTTGYDATKTSDIAKACGISEATMYKYFSSKMELLKACVVTAEPAEETMAHTDLSQCTNEDLIELYVNKRITMIERNHEQYNILFAESSRYPELSQYFDQSLYRQSAEIKEIKRRIEEGSMNGIREIFTLELGLTSGICSILQHDQMNQSALLQNLSEFRDEMIRFMKYGLIGKP